MIDINEKWAIVLLSTNSLNYATFLDIRGAPWEFWHYVPRVGLWFFWDVAAQDWVSGVPTPSAQLITCVENPL